ncbi:helix-turn-helix domain-containing protein [Breznakia pachnodae]|uniref:Transcriptional regulator with XRE-family HTH domain n=1 Tax=Breznakia pachnodae TaxID=265178 RepID=A0ABU0E8R6_9FIRM|nr:helix-turn-helix transcriptional regulator [Breznakia pachnodae]MDQ0363236.1 transcriptional regulator with XRE-family HTH domain [Breznakia pachnodae]
MNIKRNLAYLRCKYELTYANIEELTGVNHSKIHRIENGITKDPQISDITKLAKFFKVSLDDFVNENLRIKDNNLEEKSNRNN